MPAHEAVQAAHAADQLMPGPQVEVICVAKNDPGTQLLQQVLRDRLHRGDRPDRHKHRGFDRSMRQRHGGPAGIAAGCVQLKI